MTDVIFDIDGTLADASHRLHFILNPNPENYEFKKDWDSFLSDEQVAKDAPIPQTWALLGSMLENPRDYRVIFITGRPERTRQMTYDWLTWRHCPVRLPASHAWYYRTKVMGKRQGPILYMRKDGDRRPSHEVKRDLLATARMDQFNPTLVFEDRADDAAMWRSEGLLCCQVAKGNY